MAGQFQAKVTITVQHTENKDGMALIQTEAIGMGYSVQDALADSLGRMIDPSTLKDVLKRVE